MKRRDIHPRRRGFTAVELMMGLSITGLVLTALAGVMSAVAQGWRATDITQNAAIGESAAAVRIARTVREARELGTPQVFGDGSTGFMYWAEDTDNNGSRKISEMGALEFNAATKQVRVLRINTTRYDIWSGLFNLLDGDMITSIRSLLGLVYGGQPEVKVKVLADNVKSAKFTVIPAGANSDLPRVEYTVVFERAIAAKANATQTSTLYGSATLRSPAN